MARSGMANLTLRWRRMVDDAGTAIWDADQAQQILDANRTDIWKEELVPEPIFRDNDTVWETFDSAYDNLEETTGGTAVFRVYDAGGTAQGTANYTANYEIGQVVFSADQSGSARYLDARAYDLNAAAAEGWTERMAKVSGWYTFRSEGKGFNRSDYFKHCTAMADFYRGKAPMTVTTMQRSDLA